MALTSAFLGSQVATTTGTNHLLATTLSSNILNRDLEQCLVRFHVPNRLRDAERNHPELEVEDLASVPFGRIFPVHPSCRFDFRGSLQDLPPSPDPSHHEKRAPGLLVRGPLAKVSALYPLYSRSYVHHPTAGALKQNYGI